MTVNVIVNTGSQLSRHCQHRLPAVSSLQFLLCLLQAFIASDITFAMKPYFRGQFCSQDVREGLVVAFIRHIAVVADVCTGLGQLHCSVICYLLSLLLHIQVVLLLLPFKDFTVTLTFSIATFMHQCNYTVKILAVLSVTQLQFHTAQPDGEKTSSQ